MELLLTLLAFVALFWIAICYEAGTERSPLWAEWRESERRRIASERVDQ